MLGPLPRSVPLVHLLASSQETTASPQTSQVRHTNLSGNATSTWYLFRGCSHSLMFRLPRSLDLQVAPTAEAQSLQGSQAVYTTHSSVGYLPRDVASLRVRHEQLTRLDFHQLDCSLVGCSDVPDIPQFFAWRLDTKRSHDRRSYEWGSGHSNILR